MHNFKFIQQLTVPAVLKEQFPITEEMRAIKKARDAEIRHIFTGKSNKFILIVGPCSADNEQAVLEYITRLIAVQEKVKNEIFVIPRIYTNKPRTTGDGYKGMLHQPDPNKAPNLLEGIIAIRKMHSKAIAETGFTCADEMLYPENYRYLDDILSYVAVGARSVENQQHRLTGSGIDVPVGMKNPTSGDISIMMNAITAAQHPHMFAYRGWEVQTTGNDLTHAILRGYTDRYGRNLSNYHYEDLSRLAETYAKTGLKNPAVIVDVNHANSGKQYLEQVRIAKEVLHSCKHSGEIKKLVKGLMIESYLEDGAQKITDHCIYGKSITDPCLGWEKTERLILELAELISKA